MKKETNPETQERMIRLINRTGSELTSIVEDELMKKTGKIYPPEFLLNYFSLNIQFVKLLNERILDSAVHATKTAKNSGLKVQKVGEDEDT